MFLSKEDTLKLRLELQLLNDRHNQNIEENNAFSSVSHAINILKTNNIDTSLLQVNLKAKDLDQSYTQVLRREKQIVKTLLDSNQRHVVCNVLINFQTSDKSPFEDNREADKALKKEFPSGVADSELGWGFFYINEDFAPEVMAWMKKNKLHPDKSKVKEDFVFNWDIAKD